LHVFVVAVAEYWTGEPTFDPLVGVTTVTPAKADVVKTTAAKRMLHLFIAKNLRRWGISSKSFSKS